MFKPVSRLAGALLVLAVPSLLFAEDLVKDDHAVAVRSDVTYGQGIVGASSDKPHGRDLKMDVYRPLEGGKPMTGRPAVIMAFGGAYHRGSKGTARFEEDGASDSAMGDYCQAFAASGYVCLSIEYRLLPEDPAMPAGLDPALLMPKAMLKDPVVVGRINVVRARMGLPPLDDVTGQQLLNTIFASAQDLATAVNYARAHSAELGLDPERIAIGGFSAGGVSAVNAAYGLGVPVRAVISLSGGMAGFNIGKSAKPGMPPGLFVMGQNDLEGIQLGTRGVLAALAANGIKAESAWIPGFGHFYPMGAPSLGGDMTKVTLKSRVLRFLDRTLGAAR